MNKIWFFKKKVLIFVPHQINNMEALTKKFEQVLEKEMDNFGSSPVRTGLKWIIILFVLKKVYQWLLK